MSANLESPPNSSPESPSNSNPESPSNSNPESPSNSTSGSPSGFLDKESSYSTSDSPSGSLDKAPASTETGPTSAPTKTPTGSLSTSQSKSTSSSQSTSSSTPKSSSTSSTASGVKQIKTTRTSTITDHPVSTFSSPVAISVTNSDGKVGITTPPALTVLSTSTEPDGDFITYTHVIANPTSQAQQKTPGFLGNQGAMAGVFITVGILAATLGLCIAFFFRRRIRLNRRRRWLAGMQQPQPANPFEDPLDSPQMRAADPYHDDVDWNGGGPVAFNDRRHSSRSSSIQHGGMGFTGIGTGIGMIPTRVPVPPDSPMSPHFNQHPDRTGVLRIVNRDEVMHSRASMALSSPSIYPVSLPPTGDDDSPAEEEASDSQHSPPNGFVMVVPPRPPRSHLRGSIMKAPEAYPMTPPASLSSFPYSKPSSPIIEQLYSKGPRRTLLDIRSRPARDSTTEVL